MIVGTESGGVLIFKLARITGALSTGGPVSPVFPRMDGFGGLGVLTTQFVWTQVWGVDPQDPMHLIAADAVSRSMARSRDGDS